MNKLFSKRVIIDVQSTGLSGQEQHDLLGFFERTMAKSAVSGARKLTFNTSDSAIAKKQGIDGFELTVQRFNYIFCEPGDDMPETWQGEFVKGDKELLVFGALEKC